MTKGLMLKVFTNTVFGMQVSGCRMQQDTGYRIQDIRFRVFVFFFIIFLFNVICTVAQDSVRFKNSIAVVGRPSIDSISLRWAPLRFLDWQAGNQKGYSVERITLARDGKVLTKPERKILIANFKPLTEDKWEPLVKKDKYGAIAAQALFGARFETDLGKSDVFTIVNKVKENDQRFSFALFSADMSLPVARASALSFADKKVKKGEKYLYRISVSKQPGDTLRGTLFIGTDDIYSLPKLQDLTASFKDQLVNLRWQKPYREDIYTAYQVERSTNGKTFSRISDTPLITVSSSKEASSPFEYAIDSLKDISQTFYYRVRGISPFGELGTPSDVVSGKGIASMKDVPHIISGENIQNKNILVSWEISDESASAIKGFSVERSEKPNANFEILTKELLPSTVRSYEDKLPHQVNYYRVVAKGLNGQDYISPIYLAQLIDSIPPIAPVGLKASIDEFGNVELSWSPNTENDLYGYRIYKANYGSEELSQITSGPIASVRHVDKVDLNTLNENVYYQVMAIDRNQNHSPLSEKLKLPLPDKVKPQPPVMLPVKNQAQGVQLQWQPSGSDDVVRYDVYRQRSGEKEWIRIKSFNSSSDTIYQFTDLNAILNSSNSYTVTAVDDAGLESIPAMAVKGSRIDNSLRPGIKWKESIVDRENKKVTLRWEYDQLNVKSYMIFKSKENEPMKLYKTIQGSNTEFTDGMMQIGSKNHYQVMAVFESGSRSLMSKDLEINY
jgi:fibronectin type 3 domain-containing protein